MNPNSEQPPSGNLFAALPDICPMNSWKCCCAPRTSHERIVLRGQATPPGQWYDQDRDEWVLLLRGRAGLLIEGREVWEMRPGDYVLLPAHVRHRVEWTDGHEDTIWLAIHYSS